MKQMILTIAMLSVLTTGNTFAGDKHSPKEKDKQGSHEHKDNKCEKCKKDEKNCKCDHKDEHNDKDGHEHKEDKK